MKSVPIAAPASWSLGLFGLGWLAALLAVFAPAWFSGQVLAYGDTLAQDWPLRLLVVDQLRHGELPFWNPWVFGGQPLLAAIQAGVFFPGNWPFWLLEPASALNATVITALWLAGLGMAAWTRAVGLGWLPALAATGVLGLGGYMVGHLENLVIIQTASLAPWLLWVVVRLSTTAQRRYAALGAGLLALQIFAGHPQMVVFSGLLVAPYAGFRFRGVAPAQRLAYVGGLLVMAMGGLALAAIQLAPTLAFIPETQRAAIGWEQLVMRSLPPRQVLGLWLPFMFGGTPSGFFPTPYWGAPHQTDLAGYGGLAPWALLVVAVARGSQRAEGLFWAAAALATLLLAMGSFTPLYAGVAKLPLLGSLPAPGRHLLELNLALAALSALGLARLTEAVKDQMGRARLKAVFLGAAALSAGPALGGSLALLVFGGAWAARIQPYLPAGTDLAAGWAPTSPVLWLPALWGLGVTGLLLLAWRGWRGAPLGLVALLFLDLGLFGWHSGWRQRSPEARPLVATLLPGRVAEQGDQSAPRLHPPLPLSPFSRVVAIYPDTVYPYDQVGAIAALRAPNWGALQGVRHVGGYDAFVATAYAAVMGEMHAGGKMASVEPFVPGSRVLDGAGTELALLDARLADDAGWQQRLAPPRWRLLGKELGVRVYENTQARARVWRSTPALNPTNAEEPRLLAEKARSLELAVATPGPLVVSTAYNPGWTAIAEDGPAPGAAVALYRVERTWLGLDVPPGVTRVSLFYTPPGWWAGVWISALAAVMLWLYATGGQPQPGPAGRVRRMLVACWRNRRGGRRYDA